MIGIDQTGEKVEKVSGGFRAGPEDPDAHARKIRRHFRIILTDEHAIMRKRDMALADLCVRCGWTVVDLADIFGLSRFSVYRAIRDVTDAFAMDVRPIEDELDELDEYEDDDDFFDGEIDDDPPDFDDEESPDDANTGDDALSDG